MRDSLSHPFTSLIHAAYIANISKCPSPSTSQQNYEYKTFVFGSFVFLFKKIKRLSKKKSVTTFKPCICMHSHTKKFNFFILCQCVTSFYNLLVLLLFSLKKHSLPVLKVQVFLIISSVISPG